MSEETIIATFIAILFAFAFAFGYGIGNNKTQIYKNEIQHLKDELHELELNPPHNTELENELEQSQSQNKQYRQRIDKAINVYRQNSSKINKLKAQISELEQETTTLKNELQIANDTIDSQNKDILTMENNHQSVVAKQAAELELQSHTIKSLNQQMTKITSKLSIAETELREQLQAQRDLHKSLPKFEKAKAYTIKPTKTDVNKENIFYGKKFVFTGVIPYMPRTFAMQYVVDNGGHCADSVSNKTDYLVVGDDRYYTDPGSKSNKIHKANEIIANGGKVKKISYNDFLNMIDANTNILQATKEP